MDLLGVRLGLQEARRALRPQIAQALGDRTVTPVFYDPLRLKRDLDGEISGERRLLERNLIVLETVSREAIETVVKDLIVSGEFERMAVSEGDGWAALAMPVDEVAG